MWFSAFSVNIDSLVPKQASCSKRRKSQPFLTLQVAKLLEGYKVQGAPIMPTLLLNNYKTAHQLEVRGHVAGYVASTGLMSNLLTAA